jgi:predicted enzyme related to lactoylglutathione lyase
MHIHPDTIVGKPCWVDLAASDEAAARRFYERLFDWTTKAHDLAGGTFRRFFAGNDAVASLYQLKGRHLIQGVPSHWTPYVAVADTDRSAARAAALGASVVVAPFDVPGIARIALVQDPIGALFGLWQRKATALDEEQSTRC